MKRTHSQIQFNTSNNVFYNDYFGEKPTLRSSATDPDVYEMYDRLRKDFAKLKKDVEKLRCEVQGVAEESSMWTLKYSRRFVITSNILLAFYILSNRILEVLNDHSRQVISTVMNPFTWLSLKRKSNPKPSKRPEGLTSYKAFKSQFLASWQQKDSTVSGMLKKNKGRSIQYVIMQLVWKQLVLAGLLIFSSYWVGSSREDWKRKAGIVISFFINVHLALTSDVSPWTIYLNCFTLILYITARHVKNKPLYLQTLKRSLSLNSFQRLSPNYSFQQMQHKLLQEESYDCYKVVNPDFTHSPMSAPPTAEIPLRKKIILDNPPMKMAHGTKKKSRRKVESNMPEASDKNL